MRRRCFHTLRSSQSPPTSSPSQSPTASLSTTPTTVPECVLTYARSLLSNCSSIVSITGAGISTESSIPDYRSPGRPPHRPTSHQTFMANHATRQRYWARSMAGYETLASALPNSGHFALSHAEANGRLHGIITQNVDLLHEHAGSKNVLHLHGTVKDVRCMTCQRLSSRAEFQAELRRLNPSYLSARLVRDPVIQQLDHQVIPSHANRHQIGHTPTTPSSVIIPTDQRPDGDSDLSHITDYSSFIIPSCRSCTDGFGQPLPHLLSDASRSGQVLGPGPLSNIGVLKPDLVFFGANVPKHVHSEADDMIAQADALLIAGTSLTVWSAFRLVRAVLDRAVPGRASVVQVAEQIAKMRQLTSGGSYSSGSNSIQDGTAILSPVTPISLTLSSHSSYLARVPSTLPVIILNDGPTRADPFLFASEWGLAKIEARTGSTLHELLQIDRSETLKMEEAMRDRMKKEHPTRDVSEPVEDIAARLKRLDNIE